jgi:hypothetical protein
MRTSSRKTPAAVLREICGGTKGIKVPEWAKILDRSPHSIHDLESGRLKLSPALATKINYETGISIGWLMDGNPAAPPVAQDGREYTKAIYDEVQATRFRMPAAFGSFTLSGQDVDLTTVDNNWAIGHNALQFCGNICAILVNANRKQRYHLALYRTSKAIQELRTEFGEAKELDDHFKALAYVWNDKNFEDAIGVTVKFTHKSAFKQKSKPHSKKRRR